MMEASTTFLAQLLGVATLVIGLSMLIRQKLVLNVIDEVLQNRVLTYLIGIAEFIAGLLLVLSHNVWEPTVAAIITILGWLMLLEGALYLFISKKVLHELLHVFHKRGVFLLTLAAYLALGAYLTYHGFAPFFG